MRDPLRRSPTTSPRRGLLAAAAALLLVPAPSALHGGLYRPPTDPTPGGKTSLPIPGSKTPYGTGPVNQPKPPPGTQGGTLAATLDLTRWHWWWELHRDRYVDVRAGLAGAAPETGAPPSGDGDEGTAPLRPRRPTEEEVRTRVLPVLLGALEGERQPDVVSSCLVALGRVADDLDEDARRVVAERVRPYLADSTLEIAEAAVAALGILGDASQAPLLASLLADDAAGREAVGGREVRVRTRAFAAYALGLLGGASERVDVRRFCAHALVEALGEDEGAYPDVHAACVLALGLLPPGEPGEVGRVAPLATPRGQAKVEPDRPTASLAGVVHFLGEVLDDDARHDWVRAQVPLALARLLDARRHPGDASWEELRRRVASDLLARLAPMRREPRELVQSCVVALGVLGDDDDDELDARIRSTLAGIDADHSDLGARHLARIALASAGGRAGSGPEAGADPGIGAKEARRFLLKDLARGRTQAKPWSALALGVLERARLDRGVPPPDETLEALRATLRDPATPDLFGAAAIATGLVRDLDATELLVERLERGGDDQVRGSAALALGLAGASATVDRVRRLALDSVYRPFLLQESAAALGLFGDSRAAEDLVGLLEGARGLSAQASITRALGRVGDVRTIEPLVRLLEDERLPDTSRAFAAVALGLVADADPLPWTTPYAFDGNHLAAPPTLRDPVGQGLLNLL